MANLNQVNIIGRLTGDVELKHTKSGTSIAAMNIAINQKYKTTSGETREKTTFVTVEAWASLADLCAKYLAKGRQVFIGGRLELDTWEHEGQKRNRLKVVAEMVQFIDNATKPQREQNETDEAPF